MPPRLTRQRLLLLTAILLLAAGLRIVALSGVPPGLQHDEVFYAHDAYTVQHGRLTLWFSDNHGREPFFVYLLALSTALLGSNTLAIRFPSVVCGLLTVALIYQWGRVAFGRRVGMYAALFTAISFWSLWLSRVGLRVTTLPPLVALVGWLYTRALVALLQQVQGRTGGEKIEVGVDFSIPTDQPQVGPRCARIVLPRMRGRTARRAGGGSSPSRFSGSSSMLPAPQPQQEKEPSGAGNQSTRTIRRFALAGLALGLTMYAYAAAYALPLIFLAFYGYLLIFRRDVLKRSPVGHLLFWLTAILTYLPLGIALSGVEGGYLRVRQVSEPLQALQAGDLGPLLAGIRAVLLMWTHRGDPLWRYNVSEAPVLGLVTGVVFVIGSLEAVGAIARRANRSSPLNYLLLFLWLVIGVVPSMVTDLPPSSLRATVALPATYLMLAVGLERLRQLAGRSEVPRWAWPVLLAGLVGITAGRTGLLYFIRWRSAEDVQHVYRADLAEVAVYLRAHTPPGAVAISTSEPNHLDPFIFDFTPHGDVSDIRWFDGLYAMVFPAGPDPAWVFVTIEPTPPLRLQVYLDPARLVEERRFSNGALAFALYALPPGEAALDAFPPPTEQGTWVAGPLAFPPDDPEDLRRPIAYPVQFGDVAQLVGYQAETETHPGEWLPLTLVWRVTRDVRTPEPWSVFVHLLSPEGELVAGRDFLPVPASTWRVGDVFVQCHDLPLDPTLAAGTYHLEIGLYTLADGSRFPVMADGAPIGNRLLLEPVTVAP